MSAIQIKNVPAQLHERLRQRARKEGRSLSDYVLMVLERDLAVPSTREWLERLEADEPVTAIGTEDALQAVQAARSEREEQLLGGRARRD